MALNTIFICWTKCTENQMQDLVVCSMLWEIFYLSKRRAVYFDHKSIVHACDASEWVGMHSVCIKRHWPPLARPKPHFHSRNNPSPPTPILSAVPARRPCYIDERIALLLVQYNVSSTCNCSWNYHKILWIYFILKAIVFFTYNKHLIYTWNTYFYKYNFILKLIIKHSSFSSKYVTSKLGNVITHYYSYPMYPHIFHLFVRNENFDIHKGYHRSVG